MTAAENYILFELAGTTYGVCSRDVLHVEMLEHVTAVPNAVPYLEGVVFSRGRVMPAINLRVRFGLPRQDHTPRTRVLFVRHGDRTVALVVDSAREFRTIPGEAIRPLKDSLVAANGSYVAGVATTDQRLIMLLDVPAVLQETAVATAELQPTT